MRDNEKVTTPFTLLLALFVLGAVAMVTVALLSADRNEVPAEGAAVLYSHELTED
jgi:hypothetical protein